MGEGKDEKKSAPAAEMPTGLQPKEGEIIMGVCHIYASFNDTFVHVTDPSGRETLVKVTGGMKVKADRDEASPYAAMLAAQDVVAKCKELGIGGLHIKMRATVRPCARLTSALARISNVTEILIPPPLDRRLSRSASTSLPLSHTPPCSASPGRRFLSCAPARAPTILPPPPLHTRPSSTPPNPAPIRPRPRPPPPASRPPCAQPAPAHLTGWQPHEDAGAGCAVGAEGARAWRHQDWAHRGCDADPLRLHPPCLRPPRSPLVSAATDLSFRIGHQSCVRPPGAGHSQGGDHVSAGALAAESLRLVTEDGLHYIHSLSVPRFNFLLTELARHRAACGHPDA